MFFIVAPYLVSVKSFFVSIACAFVANQIIRNIGGQPFRPVFSEEPLTIPNGIFRSHERYIMLRANEKPHNFSQLLSYRLVKNKYGDSNDFLRPILYPVTVKQQLMVYIPIGEVDRHQIKEKLDNYIEMNRQRYVTGSPVEVKEAMMSSVASSRALVVSGAAEAGMSTLTSSVTVAEFEDLKCQDVDFFMSSHSKSDKSEMSSMTVAEQHQSVRTVPYLYGDVNEEDPPNQSFPELAVSIHHMEQVFPQLSMLPDLSPQLTSVELPLKLQLASFTEDSFLPLTPSSHKQMRQERDQSYNTQAGDACYYVNGANSFNELINDSSSSPSSHESPCNDSPRSALMKPASAAVAAVAGLGSNDSAPLMKPASAVVAAVAGLGSNDSAPEETWKTGDEEETENVTVFNKFLAVLRDEENKFIENLKSLRTRYSSLASDGPSVVEDSGTSLASDGPSVVEDSGTDSLANDSSLAYPNAVLQSTRSPLKNSLSVGWTISSSSIDRSTFALLCFLTGLLSPLFLLWLFNLVARARKYFIKAHVHSLEDVAISLLSSGSYGNASTHLERALTYTSTHLGMDGMDFAALKHLLARAEANHGNVYYACVLLRDVASRFERLGAKELAANAEEELKSLLSRSIVTELAIGTGDTTTTNRKLAFNSGAVFSLTSPMELMEHSEKAMKRTKDTSTSTASHTTDTRTSLSCGASHTYTIGNIKSVRFVEDVQQLSVAKSSSSVRSTGTMTFDECVDERQTLSGLRAHSSDGTVTRSSRGQRESPIKTFLTPSRRDTRCRNGSLTISDSWYDEEEEEDDPEVGEAKRTLGVGAPVPVTQHQRSTASAGSSAGTDVKAIVQPMHRYASSSLKEKEKTTLLLQSHAQSRELMSACLAADSGVSRKVSDMADEVNRFLLREQLKSQRVEVGIATPHRDQTTAKVGYPVMSIGPGPTTGLIVDTAVSQFTPGTALSVKSACGGDGEGPRGSPDTVACSLGSDVASPAADGDLDLSKTFSPY